MKPIPRISSKKYRGAGDILHEVLKPVVKVIDAVLKTDLKNCGGCKSRQKRLNRAIPFHH